MTGQHREVSKEKDMTSTNSNNSYNSQHVCSPSILNHEENKGKDGSILEKVKAKTRERALSLF